MNIHKFKKGKGKAFSYFSIVAKNYLILNNNKNYKKYKNSDNLTKLDYGRNLTGERKQVDGVDYMTEFVDDMVQYWDDNLTKLFRKKRDIQIADAVIELFKRRGDLENFNINHSSDVLFLGNGQAGDWNINNFGVVAYIYDIDNYEILQAEQISLSSN